MCVAVGWVGVPRERERERDRPTKTTTIEFLNGRRCWTAVLMGERAEERRAADSRRDGGEADGLRQV